MSRFGAALRTSAWVLLGKGAERVLRLVVIVVLARLLEPKGFGAYSFAFAFAELFAVFTDLGLNAVLVREMAKDPAETPRLLGAGVVLKLALSALSFAAAWGAAFLALAPGELRASTLAATFLLFLSFRGASLRWVLEAPFEARLQVGVPARIGLWSELLSAACLLGAAWLGLPLPVLILAQLGALAPGCVVLARRTAREMRPRLAFEPALWLRLLRAALPIGAANLCLIAYARTDILMLEWLAGTSAVGMYAAAFKLVGSLDILPLALTTPLLPLRSPVIAAGRREEAGRLYRG
ncbi:MAG: oligosaccharide flippase family protein, partial [Nitrospinota bacterium]